MTDSRLEQLLRSSAPDDTVPVDLASFDARILGEAAARRRRTPWWIAGTAVVMVTIGGGSMAVAGDGLMTPWGWVADNAFSLAQGDGTTCFQGMRIAHPGLADDAPIVLDAKEILRGIDVAALDTTEKEKELAYEGVRSAHNSDPLTQEGLRQSAIGAIVAEMLFEELAARGYEANPSPIALSADTTDCLQ
ncbi:hypothetical protein IF188_15130 [Microbacterium sp. NEAU-LLC]|uniref:DUF5667 domain-containing protein n=1 Tax=Microbacterium helvum TaxID=2773713 RepID=A0ABR8NTF5_9MICO|nr:hypothetical protein [Microbacterium helvum]MBD3943027.1 hypothetical protein [Microbacterium helvum]